LSESSAGLIEPHDGMVAGSTWAVDYPSRRTRPERLT